MCVCVKEKAREMEEGLTMTWEGIRPLVQGGIQLGDDTLLPLLVRMAQLGSRLVRRLLERGKFNTRNITFIKALTIVRFAKASI